MRVLRERFADLAALPLCTGAAQDDRPELRRHLDAVPAEWSFDLLARCRYLVGMRLHSLIFACQAGVPFVAIAYQPKCVEFCRELGLGQLAISPYGLRGVGEALSTIVREYGNVRARLLEYRAAARGRALEAVAAVVACARS